MQAPQPSVERPRAALPPWVPLLVFAAAFVAHGSALGAGWVGDDAALVRDDPAVAHGLAGAGEALGTDGWPGASEPGVWRPLTRLSFCLEGALWARDGDLPDPFAFHLTNLLLHGLAALLLLGLLRRLVPARPLLAAGAALVFAVHPLHAWTVATLAGRADLLALLLALAALLLWIRARAEAPVLLPLSGLAFFLALLSKECALALLPVALLLDVGGVLPGPAARPARRLVAYGVLLVAALLWYVRWPGAQPAIDPGLEGLGRAVLAFLIPVGLVRDHLALTDGRAALASSQVAAGVGVVVLVAALVAATVSLVRRRAFLLPLSATAAAWLVAVAVAPAGAPLEARFAYVTTPALFLVAGALLEVLLAGGGARGRVAAGVAGSACVLLALGVLCWREGAAASDEEAFLGALVDRYPDHDSIPLRASRTLRRRAEDERRRATERPLTDGERRALVSTTTAWLQDAEAWSRAVLRRADPGARGDTTAADANRELGLVLKDLARMPDSVLALREALRLEPGLADEAALAAMEPARRRVVAETFLYLARGEESIGETAKAAVHLERAAALVPDDVDVQEAAGRILVRVGEYDRAQRRLRRAADLAASPSERERIEGLLESCREAARAAASRLFREAQAHIEHTEYAEAVRLYEEALTADPSLLRAYEELAFHLAQYYGRFEVAREVIARAEAQMRQAGYAPEDVWWKRFADLRARIDGWEREALERERGGGDDEGDEDDR